ncbi:MAG: hypothetical protein A3F72_04240 [Bacteroidetes bacterium RIFCSPLOWO2_12_FULL_35_15]|nr:MAG: hypothetical protein A3F72_04240 [Bacteroidetes bacterium RIFCSPLOWO2_12_FULL_35_15]
MKKVIYYLFFVMILYYACNGAGQTKKNKKKETSVSTHKEQKGNPKVNIKVNKRYDSKGNLIAFDSTYSSYYSNRVGEKKLMDSLFHEFKPMISQEFPLMKDKRFNELFFTDTLLYNDFFHDDFFSKRYELNEKFMKNMMFQMDSIKNEFFKNQSMHLNKK